jgi:hypothetical protein
VEVGEFGRRIGAELVGEANAQIREHGECFGRSAECVQRAHQLAVRAFAQRFGADQVAQVGDGGVGCTARQPGLGEIFAGGGALLGQAAALDVEARDIGQGGTAPERERGFLAAVRREVGETVRVDLVGVDDQAVPGWVVLDDDPGQHPAQPGDLRLERVGSALRRPVTVDGVDQALGADQPTGFEQERGQQRARSRTADRDQLTGGGADLQRTEDAEAHSR